MDNHSHEKIINPARVDNQNNQVSNAFAGGSNSEDILPNQELEHSGKKRPSVQALKFANSFDEVSGNTSTPPTATSATPTSPVMGLAKKIFGVTSNTMKM